MSQTVTRYVNTTTFWWVAMPPRTSARSRALHNALMRLRQKLFRRRRAAGTAHPARPAEHLPPRLPARTTSDYGDYRTRRRGLANDSAENPLLRTALLVSFCATQPDPLSQNKNQLYMVPPPGFGRKYKADLTRGTTTRAAFTAPVHMAKYKFGTCVPDVEFWHMDLCQGHPTMP